ncbi:MAG: hydrolase [Phycisphaerae bacterium]|jgi:nicotinamidase-related amidase
MPTQVAQRLVLDRAQLVVVDIQEKMLPHITGREQVLEQSVRMIRAACEMGLPVTVSEQYVRGLGPTVGEVLEATGDAERLEKMSFSLLGDEPLSRRILGLSRPQVLLVGIETHVCVQQTALDLLAAGHLPVVLVDAVGSRRPTDRDTALTRMRDAGAVVTTVESAIFDMLVRAGTDVFKRILPLVR